MKKFIKQIRANNYYTLFVLRDKPVIVFKDHRFIIPVLWLAHKTGVIQQGINMFRFDAHLDDLLPEAQVVTDFKRVSTFAQCFEFTRDRLRKRDDDWLSFALETRMVEASVTVCEHQEPHPHYSKRSYRLNGLDGALNYQGKLSDHARSDELSPMWSVLGWTLESPNMINNSILFDIDCDYFTFGWRGLTSSWLNKFYDKEFSKTTVTYPTTNNWSHFGVVEKIIERAPFITIAIEPDFCGGILEAKMIVEKLNELFFENTLNIKKIACLKDA